ncbi:MAG: hypothetical protein KAI41_06900 [Hyphomicrobiaceae bacterium]|nr:hypothetical protein [Hyphomicrobiaceae bacterium]MCK5550243.1 hypothetical protein [Hyphomicrobiaceae bacterium]MCK5714230.1 hypothetical protein [Hyphomicrobiaceae bacterium]
MRMSAPAREQRKAAHLARLAAKDNPNYPALYAATPHEQAVAAQQGAERKARRDAISAAETTAHAENVGAVDIFTTGQIATPADAEE